MNDATREVIANAIKVKLSEIQELLQDYLSETDLSNVDLEYALLMLSLDKVFGHEDPTCTMTALFAPGYPDEDVPDPSVFYNRKVLANYVESNSKRLWQ